MQHFSLAIIGSGSGNTMVPHDGGQGPVALIESGVFGGTCLNRGCIPSKILVHTADVAVQARTAYRFGIEAEVTGADWPAIRDRTFSKIDLMSAAGRAARAESDHVTLFEGRARFTGPHELLIDGTTTITADRIVVATGARPVIPPVIAEAGVEFWTSDTIMRIDRLPASMVIVGGGSVATEFAHIFSGLGVEVRIVTLGGSLLEALDPVISESFTELARQRWDVRLSAVITDVRERDADGGVTVVLDDGGEIAGDLLLVAAGRQPNTDDLGLELAGVKVRDDGRVQVDEYGRTTADGIWSIGDASSPFQLKHVANAEARTVGHNLAHPDDLLPLMHQWVPAAVFTDPEIATVGARRQDLEGRRPYVESTMPYHHTAFGWALQDTTGFCRLYADPAAGTLLGAHIIGYQAALLIQPLIQAMSSGQTIASMARGQYWIHPALTEVVENALLKLPLDQPIDPPGKRWPGLA